MMVVILTPVDGIIRWLPRGFSCSRSHIRDLFAPSLEKFAQLVDYHMAFETVAPHV